MRLGRSTLDAQKASGRWPKKRKMRPIESIGIKIKLSPIISLLLIQVSFRPKFPKKINATKKIVEEAIQPLESMSLKLQIRTRIKLRI